MNSFGNRLKEAFETEEIPVLAKKMGVTYQAAKNYVEGRIPPAEKLTEISRSTNCSIHWLITGEGEKTLIKITENPLLGKEIDYEKVANRLLESLKIYYKQEDKSEMELIHTLRIPQNFLEKFRKHRGMHGQPLYEFIAFSTNISLNWIITGKGNQTTNQSELKINETTKAFMDMLDQMVEQRVEVLTKKAPSFTIDLTNKNEKENKAA